MKVSWEWVQVRWEEDKWLNLGALQVEGQVDEEISKDVQEGVASD